jgi:hypothetical protein
VVVTSLSNLLFAIAATALGLTGPACATSGAPAPHRPVPSSHECNREVTVGHVPGHLDRVWQLACDD